MWGEREPWTPPPHTQGINLTTISPQPSAASLWDASSIEVRDVPHSILLPTNGVMLDSSLDKPVTPIRVLPNRADLFLGSSEEEQQAVVASIPASAASLPATSKDSTEEVVMEKNPTTVEFSRPLAVSTIREEDDEDGSRGNSRDGGAAAAMAASVTRRIESADLIAPPTMEEKLFIWLADSRNKLKFAGIVLALIAVIIVIAVPVGLTRTYSTRRYYYLSIEEVEWNYAPYNQDQCRAPGQTLNTSPWINSSPSSIGAIYRKARFVQYTDSTFSQVIPSDPNLGLLGPVLRAVQGDQIRVTLINHASFPYSLNVIGLEGDKNHEGASYYDGTVQGWPYFPKSDDVVPPSLPVEVQNLGFGKGTAVEPGNSFTYIWMIPDEDSPGQSDKSSVMFIYRSTKEGYSDSDSGLMGPVVIKRNDGSQSLSPIDVDQEVFTFFSVINENDSPYLDRNIEDQIQQVYRPNSQETNSVPLFGLDPGHVVQALFSSITAGFDRLDYSIANSAALNAIASGAPIGSIQGAFIDVTITNDAIYPENFDLQYGSGKAKSIVNALLGPILDKKSKAFKLSNIKHTINGYLYCNGPTPQINVGNRVRWYVAAVGNSVHNAQWPSQVSLPQLQINAGATASVDFVPAIPGIYQFGSSVELDVLAGMTMLYNVTSSSSSSSSPTPSPAASATGQVNYYLAAEEIEWNYSPEMADICSGQALSAQQRVYTRSAANRVGTNYRKSKFVQYTDSTFSTRVNFGSNWLHLGILGPPLRVAANMNISVTVLNSASFNIGFSIDGFIALQPSTFVTPNSTFTFSFFVPPSVLSSSSSSSLAFVYTSNHLPTDINAGLVGAVIVTAQNTPLSMPSDISQELIILAGIFDENNSPLSNLNFGRLQSPNFATLANDYDFQESNRKYSINGYLFCQAPYFAINESALTRVYMIGIGGSAENNLQADSIAIDGVILTKNGNTFSVSPILPKAATTFDFIAPTTTLATLYIRSRNPQRLIAGESAMIIVSGSTSAPPLSSPVRTYYIAADEVEWNYCPIGNDQCLGNNFDSTYQNAFSSPTQIGTTFLKAIYREYSDSSFSNLRQGISSRDNSLSQHLGILGPVLRAQTGDTIRVVLKNNLRFPVSFALDGHLSIGLVNPGQVGEYVHQIAFGPSANDMNSIALPYYSDVDRIAHTNAGLFGVLIVASNTNGNVEPVKAGREFVVAFAEFDENLSPFLEDNLARYLPTTGADIRFDDPDFMRSNIKPTINGYMYCNGAGFEIKEDQSIRVYLLAVGKSAVSPFLFGHSWSLLGQYTQGSTMLLPGITQAVGAKGINPGNWLLRSEVGESAKYGQAQIFKLDPRPFSSM